MRDSVPVDLESPLDYYDLWLEKREKRKESVIELGSLSTRHVRSSPTPHCRRGTKVVVYFAKLS